MLWESLPWRCFDTAGYRRVMSRHRLIAIVLLAASGLVAACSGTGGDSAPAPSTEQTPATATGFSVWSPSFSDGGPMPEQYATSAAGGKNISAPLAWDSPPPGVASFAIEVVDLHPMAREWVHWLVTDVPADARDIREGASGSSMPAGSRELLNGFGTLGWGGPQPPRGTGQHDYRFTVYALDTARVSLPEQASLSEFQDAMERHSLSSASMTGTFQR